MLCADEAITIYGHNYTGHRCTGTCCVPLESSRRGGHFEYRHAYARAVDMPSAMADVVERSIRCSNREEAAKQQCHNYYAITNMPHITYGILVMAGAAIAKRPLNSTSISARDF